MTLNAYITSPPHIKHIVSMHNWYELNLPFWGYHVLTYTQKRARLARTSNTSTTSQCNVMLRHPSIPLWIIQHLAPAISVYFVYDGSRAALLAAWSATSFRARGIRQNKTSQRIPACIPTTYNSFSHRSRFFTCLWVIHCSHRVRRTRSPWQSRLEHIHHLPKSETQEQ